MIIGLTGGSGAGKSSISRLFQDMGVYVIDADLAARHVMEPGEACLGETVRAFGPQILKPGGTLDRKKLGDIVFQDTQSLQTLNAITHKYITHRILGDIKKHACQDVMIDGAVLIESGISRMCDAIISVIADEDVRTERIIKRDGLTKEQARARIQAQKKDQFYIENSDFLIYNNSKDKLPAEQVKEVMRQLREREDTKKRTDF